MNKVLLIDDGSAKHLWINGTRIAQVLGIEIQRTIGDNIVPISVDMHANAMKTMAMYDSKRADQDKLAAEFFGTPSDDLTKLGLRLTHKADGAPLDQLLAIGWTIDTLLDHGLLERDPATFATDYSELSLLRNTLTMINEECVAALGSRGIFSTTRTLADKIKLIINNTLQAIEKSKCKPRHEWHCKANFVGESPKVHVQGMDFAKDVPTHKVGLFDRLFDMTIREFQTNLPWSIKYSEDFRRNPQSHKDFAHALTHVHKAAGALSAFVDDMDHDKNDALKVLSNQSMQGKFIADLVICAMRMANTFPGGVIDLQQAVKDRIESKNGVKL